MKPLLEDDLNENWRCFHLIFLGHKQSNTNKNLTIFSFLSTAPCTPTAQHKQKFSSSYLDRHGISNPTEKLPVYRRCPGKSVPSHCFKEQQMNTKHLKKHKNHHQNENILSKDDTAAKM